MLKSLITYSATLAITLGSVTSALAQKLDDAKNPNEIDRLEGLPDFMEDDLRCKAVCTFTPKKGDLFYVKIGSKYYAAPLVGEGVSQDIPVRGVRKFTLYKKTQDEEGEDLYTPAVEATLTGTGKEHLIILTQKKDQPITAAAHSLSTTKLPANNVHLFNLSPVDLGVQVGEETYIVKQQKQMSHKFGASGRNEYASAKIVMRYDGETKIMGSKRLRLIPGRRVIFICFASAKRAQLGSTPMGMVTIQDKP